jgi:hypothetical protein
MLTLDRSLRLVLSVAMLTSCAVDPDEIVDDDPDLDGGKADGPSGSTPEAGSTLDCEILIVGGGTGGVAAALGATRTGSKVCITEETDWLGGQFTQQGLNASDEHRFIDTTGSTKSFAQLRKLMRDHYGGKSNPGGCWVSHLCAEPKVALGAIGKLTRTAITNNQLRVFYKVKPVEAHKDGTRLTGATFARVADNKTFRINAKQMIDATELGDLIKLSGAGYRAGQEPRSDTNEADAPTTACVDCVQSYTYQVILEKRPTGETHLIPKPAGYGVDPWMKGFSMSGFAMFGASSVWNYRRIRDASQLGGTDLSIMNWGDGNDYAFGNLLDKSPDEVSKHLARAKQRALAYVYWLQTEADGKGYPYLKLRTDLLGTTDGVAKYPYIREARRLRALVTIRAEDISDAYNTGARARPFLDTVGIGFYPMDMHKNSSAGSGFPRGHSLPFQVPLGALIPEATDGLLASAKNFGTTHLSNSAYRLHPIEWTAGEAAGTFAAMCLSWGIQPREAYAHEGHVRELQERLLADGVPVYWTDDVLPSDADWRAIQFVAGTGVMGGPEASSIHWLPDATLNRAQTALALVTALNLPLRTPATASFSDVPTSHWAFSAIETLVAAGVVSGIGNNQFGPAQPVTARQLRTMIGRATTPVLADLAVPSSSSDDQSAVRRIAARALWKVVRDRLNLP